MTDFEIVGGLEIDAPVNPKVQSAIDKLQREFSRVGVGSDALDRSTGSAADNMKMAADQSQKTAVAQKTGVTNATETTRQLKAQLREARRITNEVKKTNAFFAGIGSRISSFFRFSIASLIVTQITQPIIDATKAVIDLDKSQITLQQVTQQSTRDVGSLASEVLTLGKNLGIASGEVLKADTILAQAGFNLDKIKALSESIARTDLAPSFESLDKTTEGIIAVLNQFRLENNQVQGAKEFLDIVNEVSKNFAVESGNIIEAVRNAGSVFASAENLIEGAGSSIDRNIDSFKEFVSIFTAVRSTSRLTPSVISTGLRTVTQRLQRQRTTQGLQDIFGDDFSLRDADGAFLGVEESIRKIGDAIDDAGFSQASREVSEIVEVLGGIRQAKVVIPLLFNQDILDKVREVADTSDQSVLRDSIKAQEGLGVRINKVKKEFFELFVEISKSDGFQSLIENSFILADALTGIVQVVDRLIPLLGILATSTIGGFLANRTIGSGAISGLTSQNVGNFFNTPMGGRTQRGIPRIARVRRNPLFEDFERARAQGNRGRILQIQQDSRDAAEFRQRTAADVRDSRLRAQASRLESGRQFLIRRNRTQQPRPGIFDRARGVYNTGRGAFNRAFGQTALLSAEGITDDAELANIERRNAKIIQGNNRASNRLFVAGAAGFFAGQFLENNSNLFGDSFRARRNTQATGAGISGAIIGGAIGSQVLPGVGTAAGAAVGAILGFSNALTDFNRQELFLKLDKQIQFITNRGFRTAPGSGRDLEQLTTASLGRFFADGGSDQVDEAFRLFARTEFGGIGRSRSNEAIARRRGIADQSRASLFSDITNTSLSNDSLFLNRTRDQFKEEIEKIRRAGFNSIQEFIEDRGRSNTTDFLQLRSDIQTISGLSRNNTARFDQSINEQFSSLSQAEIENLSGTRLLQIRRQALVDALERARSELASAQNSGDQQRIDQLSEDIDNLIGESLDFRDSFTRNPNLLREIDSDIFFRSANRRGQAGIAIAGARTNQAFNIAQNNTGLFNQQLSALSSNTGGLNGNDLQQLINSPALSQFFNSEAGSAFRLSQSLSRAIPQASIDALNDKDPQQAFVNSLRPILDTFEDTTAADNFKREFNRLVDDSTALGFSDALRGGELLEVADNLGTAAQDLLKTTIARIEAQSRLVQGFVDNVVGRQTEQTQTLLTDNQFSRGLGEQIRSFIDPNGIQTFNNFRANRLQNLTGNRNATPQSILDRINRGQAGLNNQLLSAQDNPDLLASEGFINGIIDSRTELENLQSALKILAEDTSAFDEALKIANREVEDFQRGAATLDNLFNRLAGSGGSATDINRELQLGSRLAQQLVSGNLGVSDITNEENARALQAFLSTVELGQADRERINTARRDLVLDNGGREFLQEIQRFFPTANILPGGQSEADVRRAAAQQITDERIKLEEARQVLQEQQGQLITNLRATVTDLVNNFSENNIPFGFSQAGVDQMKDSMTLFAEAVNTLQGSKLSIEGTLDVRLDLEGALNDQLAQSLGNVIDARLQPIIEDLADLRLDVRNI